MKKNKYWFKAKKYGCGFVPVTWEGWLMVLLVLLLIWTSAYIRGIYEEPVSLREGLAFVFDFIIILLVTIPLHQKKCKQKMKWRWGK